MFEHVVLGTDFSDSWRSACRFLRPLKALLGIDRITLVHVLDVHPLSPEENLRRKFKPRLDQLAANVSAETGIPIETHMRTGSAVHSLLTTAHELDADAIMVACRGESTLREMFLGNVVLDLARLTDRPLLILPSHQDPATDTGPVLLATDASAACADAESQFEALIADGHPGLVLTVEPNQSDANHARIESHARSLAAGSDKANASIVHGNPRQLIAETARQQQARLIIVGQRGHNPLEQLLLGSTAEAVCRRAVCPVLLVPGTATPRDVDDSAG